MWHRLRSSFGEFVVNLELYVVLLIAAGALVLHLLGGSLGWWSGDPTSIVISANLVALTLIAIGLTRDRAARRTLDESIRHIVAGHSQELGDVLVPWTEHATEFRARLERAQTLSLLVRTPLRTVERYELSIQNVLRLRDARVRILAIDPHSDAMQVLARSDEQCQAMMQLFLDHTLPALARASGAGDQIQVRVTDVVPSCLLALLDEDTAQAVAYVTILSARQHRDLRPSFRVTPADGSVYQFFKNEFVMLWEGAQAVADVRPADSAPRTATTA